MNSLINLDKISKEDALSVSTALLYSLKGIPQYSVLSELPYILDYENFIKFIKYFGGMTIRVPTPEELSDLLKILLLYQNYKVSGLSWKESLIKSGFSESESNSARAQLQILEKQLKSQEVGGRSYE